MRRAAASFVCLLLLPASASAQLREAPPLRPDLPAGADTNSPTVYYDFGVQKLRTDPAVSAAAFYWAGRLNPEAAAYPYARRVALMLTDPRRMLDYFRGDRRVIRSPQVQAMDSLLLRALQMDPFLHPGLDDILLLEWIKADWAQYIRLTGDWADENTMRQIVEEVSWRDPSLAASLANSRGRFTEALDYWGRQARRSRHNARLRVLRARAFYLTGNYDSARTEMQSALDMARRRDADSISFFYESKSAWEYSLGQVLERLGDVTGAREAFERSLIEDLSYYPAHVQLGMLHIGRADTAAALREFERAVISREEEYLPRVTYAYFLANSGRPDSAAVQLRRAIELEPWAAPPRLMLGAVLDRKGDAAGALAAFEGFIAQAPRNDQDLASARARVAQLRTARRP
jgi:tetratricopeptide (TPR) repeat protein